MIVVDFSEFKASRNLMQHSLVCYLIIDIKLMMSCFPSSASSSSLVGLGSVELLFMKLVYLTLLSVSPSDG